MGRETPCFSGESVIKRVIRKVTTKDILTASFPVLAVAWGLVPRLKFKKFVIHFEIFLFPVLFRIIQGIATLFTFLPYL